MGGDLGDRFAIGRHRDKVDPMLMRLSAPGAVILAMLSLCACIPDLSGLAGGCRDCDDADGAADAAGGEDSGTDGSAPTPDGGADASCPGHAGPSPVRVTTPAGSFCIDSTEVTNDAYAAFVDATSKTSVEQPAMCAWNTSFVPSGWPPAAGRGALPVTNVDWCDAFAFCTWAGKRLCGRIGGGTNRPDDENDAAQSEWFAACTGGGARTYPYGDAYDRSACTGDATSPAAAGSLKTCEGGYPGVFDMSGNVEEWVDACTGSSGANDDCLARGGDYSASSEALTCRTVIDPNRNESRLEPRSLGEPWRGFRCCGS